MNSVPHLLSTREAAEILNVLPDTITAYTNRGTLKGVRQGRAWLIYADSVAAFRARRDAPKQRLRVDPGPTKVCSRCGVERSASEYQRNERYRDNLESWCKSCHADYRRTPQQRQRAKEEYRRRYADPAYRARHRARSNAYHRERWRTDFDYRRRKNEQNAASKRRAHRLPSIRWRSRMRSQQRRHAHKYHGLTSEQWAAICAAYDNRCVCCGRQRKLTMDHVVPFTRGGPLLPENLQPLCQSCNSRKGTKVIDYRPDKGRRLYRQIPLALD